MAAWRKKKESCVKISRTLMWRLIVISKGVFGFHHRWHHKRSKNPKRGKMFLGAMCWNKVWWCRWLTTNTSFPTLVQGKSYNSCLTDPTFCKTQANTRESVIPGTSTFHFPLFFNSRSFTFNCWYFCFFMLKLPPTWNIWIPRKVSPNVREASTSFLSWEKSKASN